MQPNMSAIAEYKQKEEQYLQRVEELDSATNSRDAARKEFDDLRQQRLDCFMAGFSVITTKLKEMYQVCVCVCVIRRVRSSGYNILCCHR